MNPPLNASHANRHARNASIPLPNARFASLVTLLTPPSIVCYVWTSLVSGTLGLATGSAQSYAGMDSTWASTNAMTATQGTVTDATVIAR